jgi:hypothetical protein
MGGRQTIATRIYFGLFVAEVTEPPPPPRGPAVAAPPSVYTVGGWSCPPSQHSKQLFFRFVLCALCFVLCALCVVCCRAIAEPPRATDSRSFARRRSGRARSSVGAMLLIFIFSRPEPDQ